MMLGSGRRKGKGQLVAPNEGTIRGQDLQDSPEHEGYSPCGQWQEWRNWEGERGCRDHREGKKKNTERKEESKRAIQANKSSRAVARGNEEGDTEVEVDKDRRARGRSWISPEERRGREGDTWDRKTRQWQSLTHSDGCGYR
jgi:hypothetical protein